jgi:hypothetical protein
MARLLSVNVGPPRDVTWNGKTVRTAIWKSPVTSDAGSCVHAEAQKTAVNIDISINQNNVFFVISAALANLD